MGPACAGSVLRVQLGVPNPGYFRDSLLALSFNASERAVEIDPDDPVSWLVKGRVARLVDLTDYTPALFAVRKSLSIDSTNADAWFQLGSINSDLLDDSGRITAWRRAAMLNPTDPQTLAFIGFHYLWTGDYARGVPWTDSAVKLDPTFILARESSAQLALELHRPLDAQRHYEAEISLTKGRQQATPLAMIARAFLALGDSARARAYLKRSERLADLRHPNKHEAVWIGSALAAFGDTSAAVRLLGAYQPEATCTFSCISSAIQAFAGFGGSGGQVCLLQIRRNSSDPAENAESSEFPGIAFVTASVCSSIFSSRRVLQVDFPVPVVRHRVSFGGSAPAQEALNPEGIGFFRRGTTVVTRFGGVTIERGRRNRVCWRWSWNEKKIRRGSVRAATATVARIVAEKCAPASGYTRLPKGVKIE